MISRVAESCFWLQRYIERVENTARMLQVNLASAFELPVPHVERWRPFLVVVGEEQRFDAIHGLAKASDPDVVQSYLIWEERNPASIISSYRWARENARSVRETISLETWECLNHGWLWLTTGPAKRAYSRDRHSFYTHLVETCLLLHGICHNTIEYAEPFDFMRLGMLLERAGQTARILDVKYHVFGPTDSEGESPAELAHWLALLRSCSASGPFLRHVRTAVTGRAVAGFLILHDTFPRAILHCLARALHFLERIRSVAPSLIGHRSSSVLRDLVEHVERLPVADLDPAAIHRELTLIVDQTAAVSAAVHSEFFDPALPDQRAGDAGSPGSVP